MTDKIEIFKSFHCLNGIYIFHKTAKNTQNFWKGRKEPNVPGRRNPFVVTQRSSTWEYKTLKLVIQEEKGCFPVTLESGNHQTMGIHFHHLLRHPCCSRTRHDLILQLLNISQQTYQRCQQSHFHLFAATGFHKCSTQHCGCSSVSLPHVSTGSSKTMNTGTIPCSHPGQRGGALQKAGSQNTATAASHLLC